VRSSPFCPPPSLLPDDIRSVCRRHTQRPAPRLKSGQRLCDLVLVATAVAFAVPLTELVAASRGERSVAFARQSAMYLAHVTFGLSYSEIGEVFGRDRTTAAHACRLVEDRREDPAIDALMSSLESACATLHAGLDAALAAERAQASSRRPS